MAAAHGVATAVLTETGVRTLVKWPNDLLIERRKVCGILAETLVQSRTSILLVGIGVNVNNTVPQDRLPRAISLMAQMGHSVDLQRLRDSVMTRVALDIDTLILRGFDIFRPWMDANLALRDELVAVEFNNQLESGRVAGLSGTGALLLKKPDGSLVEVDAGSVYDW
jgi:BirA family biotin operon repressor/biotin-[acetyl-CoA-carboxylase] ligase